jgi:hypothetical protein
MCSPSRNSSVDVNSSDVIVAFRNVPKRLRISISLHQHVGPPSIASLESSIVSESASPKHNGFVISRSSFQEIGVSLMSLLLLKITVHISGLCLLHKEKQEQ